MHTATGCDEVPAEQPEFRVQLREDVVYGRVGDRELLLDALIPCMTYNLHVLKQLT